jgi:hypothetical protein
VTVIPGAYFPMTVTVPGNFGGDPQMTAAANPSPQHSGLHGHSTGVWGSSAAQSDSDQSILCSWNGSGEKAGSRKIAGNRKITGKGKKTVKGKKH